jgi:hypothetical protein
VLAGIGLLARLRFAAALMSAVDRIHQASSGW